METGKRKAKERIEKLKSIGFVKQDAGIHLDEDGDFYVEEGDILEITIISINGCGCGSGERMYLHIS